MKHVFAFTFACAMAAAATQTACSGEAQSLDEHGSRGDLAVGEVQAALDTQVDIIPVALGQDTTGHRMKYYTCAGENSTCNLGTAQRYVAFGPTGGGSASAFKFSLMSGSFGCLPTQFGAPKTSSVPRSCYFTPYTFLPDRSFQQVKEGGVSLPTITGTVAFGANGSFNYKTYTFPTQVSCDAFEFGQPPGAGSVVKACYMLDRDYSFTGVEHSLLQAFALPVAYCGNGQCKFKVVSGANLPCDNNTFGDPNPGFQKSCYQFHLGRLIATEGSSYTTGTLQGAGTDVAYGSGTNGLWYDSTAASGDCTNSFFGADPDVGLTKLCYTSF